MYDENVINLTRVYPWMTFEEAWLLMKWSYAKNKPGEKHGTLKALMGIDFGMFQWKGEDNPSGELTKSIIVLDS